MPPLIVNRSTEVADMNHPVAKPTEDASIGELITQLSSQTTRLVRDEMRLAQNEFVDSAKHAGIGAGLISAAGLLAVFGLASVIAAAIAAIAARLAGLVSCPDRGRGAVRRRWRRRSGQQEEARPAMSTDPTPPSSKAEPGPDADIDGTQADIE